jgi:hypothetical protein
VTTVIEIQSSLDGILGYKNTDHKHVPCGDCNLRNKLNQTFPRGEVERGLLILQNEPIILKIGRQELEIQL